MGQGTKQTDKLHAAVPLKKICGKNEFGGCRIATMYTRTPISRIEGVAQRNQPERGTSERLANRSQQLWIEASATNTVADIHERLPQLYLYFYSLQPGIHIIATMGHITHPAHGDNM